MAKSDGAKSEEKENEKERDDAAENEGEGENEAKEGETAGEGKKKLSKKMLIIIAAAAFLVLGSGGAAFFFMGGDNKKENTSQSDRSSEEGKPVYLALGDILVNLSGEGKRPNFLKISVSLELADEKDKAAIEAIKPRVLDEFQVYLRELRIEDLRGSAGLYRLREELLLRVTEAAQPVRVRDVLFQEMLVQ